MDDDERERIGREMMRRLNESGWLNYYRETPPSWFLAMRRTDDAVMYQRLLDLREKWQDREDR